MIKNYKHIILIIFFLALVIPVNRVQSVSNSDLIIHLIEAFESDDQNSFEVKIHLSVLDNNKKPVTDLQIEDFIVKENSKDVELLSANSSKDVPINMIILLDITGSMSGRIRTAREAINSFIDSLGKDSQVAIYTFGLNLDQIVGLSSDLDKVTQTFNNANIIASNESACIFDAAYEVAEIAETLPQGRRAVVLLTDSQNTSTIESGCSFYTLDDVITKANQSEIQIPFYPLGVGANVDETGLQRLAARTGGIHHSSIDNQGLQSILNQIHETLSSEYILSYTSQAAPGIHSISIGYDDLLSSKSFSLPALPPLIEFQFPQDGQEIKPEIQRIILNIMERGIPFKNITFMVDDLAIGIGGNRGVQPYSYEIDFSQFAGREISLSSLLFDENGKTLSTKTISLNVLAIGEEFSTTVVPGPEEIIEIENNNNNVENFPIELILAVSGGFLLIVIIYFVLKKNRKKKKKNDFNDSGLDATIDGIVLPGNEFGRLTVLSSDDPGMIGKEYLLSKSEFSIGRSIENDLSLPKDSAVSRHHVTILLSGSNIILREELKSLPDGTKTPPTYGTYVNDRKISGDVMMKNGDEISLGRRTKLRFMMNLPATQVNAGSEGMTFDGFEIPNQESDDTLDG